MAYSEAAAQRRRCTEKRADGSLCRAWALWDDPRQLCVAHAGRLWTGPYDSNYRPPFAVRTKAQPCTCIAYSWPHRPGGGLCQWPDPPLQRDPTPASTHRPRPRNPGMRELIRRYINNHLQDQREEVMWRRRYAQQRALVQPVGPETTRARDRTASLPLKRGQTGHLKRASSSEVKPETTRVRAREAVSRG